ncbi:MAG: sigma-70 family RNA polymerase sigma factor [Ruminiclostridium sp.]|nr:sigma-70 family RNA polymerase sigma factor [Ruminiclostridium sp.]
MHQFSQIPCHKSDNYFASVIEHRSIDICRRKTNHPTENFDEQLDLRADERVEETALSNTTVDEIKSAMNELSGKDYEMLYLYLFKQISPKEIGETMGISENNIRTYIKRARKRFLHKRGMIMTVEEKLAQAFIETLDERT